MSETNRTPAPASAKVPTYEDLETTTLADLMADFGKRIAEIRKERQLTQSQLADLLEVQPPAISRWENGVSKPQFDYVVKLAEVLEVSFDELLGDGDGERDPSRFEIRDRRLKELCRQVDQLAPQDQEVICHVMNSLVRKERIKVIMADQ